MNEKGKQARKGSELGQSALRTFRDSQHGMDVDWVTGGDSGVSV